MEKINTSESSRRDFLKLAAGGMMAATAVGTMTSLTQNTTEAFADTPVQNFDQETEVLVLGGGSGGVFAAHFAHAGGKEVTLVEASPTLGGTLLIAGGGFHSWDLNDPEVIAEKFAYADPEMIKHYMENWIPLRDWMIENVTNCNALQMENPPYAYIDGAMIGPTVAEKIQAFEGLVDGVDVQLSTKAVDLISDENGDIIGAIVEREGELIRIGAENVIVATGSYPANKEMVTRYLGRWGDKCSIRATPYNTGAGINMAVKAGALMSSGTGHFYGHLVPYPPLFPQTINEYDAVDKDAAKSILSTVQAISIEGLAINLNGKRYADESFAPYVGDNYLANDTSQQEGARAFVVIDSAQDRTATLESLEAFGAVYAVADTVEELVEMMAPYGLNAKNAIKTITEYQAAAAAGITDELDIPKSPMQTGYLTMLDTPPFIAVQAAPGLSGFYGGLKINKQCQVLDYNEEPITGLYAVPMAAGGIYYKEYAGALALCATFGKIAGEAVAS